MHSKCDVDEEVSTNTNVNFTEAIKIYHATLWSFLDNKLCLHFIDKCMEKETVICLPS